MRSKLRLVCKINMIDSPLQYVFSSLAGHTPLMIFFSGRNLHYKILTKQHNHAAQMMVMVKYIRENHMGTPSIVFRLSKKKTERVAKALAVKVVVPQEQQHTMRELTRPPSKTCITSGVTGRYIRCDP